MTPAVARHRTALTRSDLSRPVSFAIKDGYLDARMTFFDYGCGKGDDVRRLTKLGISSSGWDPIHCPTAERQRSRCGEFGIRRQRH